MRAVSRPSDVEHEHVEGHVERQRGLAVLARLSDDLCRSLPAKRAWTQASPLLERFVKRRAALVARAHRDLFDTLVGLA